MSIMFDLVSFHLHATHDVSYHGAHTRMKPSVVVEAAFTFLVNQGSSESWAR